MRNSPLQRRTVSEYMKNRVVSEETRQKLSKALKGRKVWNKGLTKSDLRVAKYTEVKIGKSRPDMLGENNPAWNGGVTPQINKERVRFRKLIQKQVLMRDDYICQICGVRGGILHVDHIQSWKDYVELRFEMSNCRTLCQSCHYQITFGKPMPKDKKLYWGIVKGGN